MVLAKKTLEKLRQLINEDTEYRSGPVLVSFFNDLGSTDSYGQGFPSRWRYTDDRIEQLNGTPGIDKCIRKVFDPANFIGRFSELDGHIAAFNQYLTFDKWRVVRDQADISFKKLDRVEIDDTIEGKDAENEFLSREFSGIDISLLGLEGAVTEVLQHRVNEIERCFTSDSPLAVILLAGSTLEGLLLGLAIKYPREFNSAIASPKDAEGKVKKLHEWTLSSFIDVAKELGLIQYDTQKFSHSLRDFRNYIHPFEQMSSGFRPREHTAKICLQVLKAVIFEIGENIGKLRT